MNRILVSHKQLMKKFTLPDILILILFLTGLNLVFSQSDLNLTLSLFWIIILLLNPLYTAPLIGGEYGAGTDSFLFTLPFSDRKTIIYLFLKGFIPLGKLIFLVMIGLLPQVLLKSADLGQFSLSLAGLLLGGSVLTASGLFLSSLFKKTAPAWFVTLLIQGIFFLVSPLLGSRISPFFLGYLPWGHTVLFICLLFISLILAFISFRLKREGSANKANIPLLEILILAVLSFFLPGGMDLTQTGHYRLNSVTARKIRSLEDPLLIRWYHTDNLELLFPQSPTLDYFMDSMKIKGAGKVSVSENRDVDARDILNLGRSRGWLEQTASKGDSFEPLYSAIEIEYRGRTETLPLVYDPVIVEEQMLSAIQRLVEGRIPEIGIITGRTDRPLDVFWTILSDSLKEYYTIRDYTGNEELLSKNNPACLFVLNGRDLNSWSASQIMNYAREGGSVLTALSPLELNPQMSDLIEFNESNPLIKEINQLGITWGESYIQDRKGSLYLSTGDNRAPDLYPLWFRTTSSRLFDYDALWSVPLYYKEEVLWKVRTSSQANTVGLLSDISPESLSRTPNGIMTSYDTALAISLDKGLLVVVSGSESLSDLMVLGGTQGFNGAWIQSLAFFLSRNQEMLELRESALGGVR